MDERPSEAILRWAAEVVGAGARVVAIKSLSRPWLLHIEHGGSTHEVVLRVVVPGWIGEKPIATGAAALRLAEAHGLAAPRLIASDLRGHITGAAATLETALPGSSASPPKVSMERLRAAGAALAKVHAVPLTPQRDLPLRLRATDVDDRTLERRWATLYQASLDSEKPAAVSAFCELTGWTPDGALRLLSGTRSSPLLQLADDRLRGTPRPQADTVFLHGDVWAGNMLWSGDTCVTLIDWKNAGVGDPGVDLGQLRMKMAIQYGLDAPDHVLHGWQRESGQPATNVAYWDVVAAAYSPTLLDDYEPGFNEHGHEIDWPTKTKRRDAFLRKALDKLSAQSAIE